MKLMKQLIILGANARAAAYSAHRAGFEPFAIDLFGDRDLADVGPVVRIERYPSGFLAALNDTPHAPWIYTGGLENYPRLIERLAAVRPLWGNRGAGLRAVRDPARLAEVVSEAGLPFPRTIRMLETGQDQTRWLVKRRRSSGGLGVRFAAASDLRSPPRGTILQEYIEGQAASATFVAAGGKAAFLGASRQLLGHEIGMESRPFLYAGSIGPLELGGDEIQTLQSLADLLAGRFVLVGLFGVDFVRTEDALWPIEVNPRYTASVEALERATGRDFLALHAAACEAGAIPAGMPRKAAMFVGKRIVYARRDATVLPEFDVLLGRWNETGQPPAIADLPRIGQTIRAGQPVVTVFAAGSSESVVKVRLEAMAKEVEQRLGELPNTVNPEP